MHTPADQGREPERALEIDADDLVEIVFGDLLERGIERRHPRIVDQDIHLAEVLPDSVGHGLDIVPATHMAGAGVGPYAQSLQGRGSLVAGRLLAADDRDIRPGPGERLGHGASKTPRSAGDQGDLAGQPPCLAHAAISRVAPTLCAREAAMKRSRSPLSTPSVSDVSTWVRRSLTI